MHTIVIKINGLLLFMLLIFTACENDMAEVERIVKQDEIAIERAKEVEMLYSDSAIVKIRIKAPEMMNYLDKKEPKRVFTKGLNVDIFNEDKKIVSRLSAKYAIQNVKENKVILQDSVEVVTLQNEKLQTEELIWDEKEDKVYTEKYVKMSTATEIIYGYGFNSNLDFTKWKVKDVTGTIDASDVMDGIEE